MTDQAMRRIRLGSSGPHSSRLVYGCMRIAGDGSSNDLDRGRDAIRAALEAGFTQFDHADIYGDGRSESLFGAMLQESPGLREQVLITSKCGVRRAGSPKEYSPKRYDLTPDYIRGSVESSLQRLRTDRLDLFLLHRPDFLMRAEEVAEALRSLRDAGKVLHFGVSNFSPSQVELLNDALGESVIVNQVEINLHNVDALTNGVLDQCQRLSISPLAWCPLGGVAYPAWGGVFEQGAAERLEAELDRQSDRHGVAREAIALAWLLKHPARVLPIIGSTTPSRIRASVNALEIDYSRDDWYRLFEARNGQRVP